MSSFEFCFIYLNLSLLRRGRASGAGVLVSEGLWRPEAEAGQGGLEEPVAPGAVEGAAGPRGGGFSETGDPSSRA